MAKATDAEAEAFSNDWRHDLIASADLISDCMVDRRTSAGGGVGAAGAAGLGRSCGRPG